MFLHVRGACGARTVARERHLVLSMVWCEERGRGNWKGFEVYEVRDPDIDTFQCARSLHVSQTAVR
jgi:hypothetical protein